MGKTGRSIVDAGQVTTPPRACCNHGAPLNITPSYQHSRPLNPHFVETGKSKWTHDLTFDTSLPATEIVVLPEVVVQASDPLTSPVNPPELDNGPLLIINFDPTEPGIPASIWQQSTVYALSVYVVANGNVYFAAGFLLPGEITGESAATGTGPSGTGAQIIDNEIFWAFVQPTPLPALTALNTRALAHLHPQQIISEANVPPGDYPGDLPPTHSVKQKA